MCADLEHEYISEKIVIEEMWDLQGEIWKRKKKIVSWVSSWPKGQLKSEWIYEVIVSPKMQTKNYKDFCPTK